jgi:FxsC-like protein
MSYFFLSDPQSNPLSGISGKGVDLLAETFFADLKTAVKRKASAAVESAVGVFDRDIMLKSSDWKTISKALSGAQAFIPLYSDRYLSDPIPQRELACFRERVVRAVGRESAERRVVSVLWTPMARESYPAGLRRALEPSTTNPEYAHKGLRALLFDGSKEAYAAVVGQLANRVVQLAEQDPIVTFEQPDAGDIGEPPREPRVRRPLSAFTLEVAAPTVAGSSAAGGGGVYGVTATQWCPFPGQERPLACHAEEVIRRFDFDPRIREAGEWEDPAARRPGIILIDPAYIAQQTGRDTLRAIVSQLPGWVLPLLVIPDDDPRTVELAAEVRRMLSEIDASPTEWARRGRLGAKSPEHYAALVPRLVAEAERQYLRYHAGRGSHGLPGPAAASAS